MASVEPLSEATFKDAVRGYVELYDEIAKSQKVLRDLRRRKEDLAKAILEFMKKNRIDEFQIGDGKLMRKQSKRTECLKKDCIINALKSALGDDTKADAIFTNMNANRNVVETETLRRTRQGKTTAAE